jgi:hypothetical protein
MLRLPEDAVRWAEQAQVEAARAAESHRYYLAEAECEKAKPKPDRNTVQGRFDLLYPSHECTDKIPAERKFDDPPFSWWPAITFLSLLTGFFLFVVPAGLGLMVRVFRTSAGV